MNEYIAIKEIADHLPINKGDIIYISSDVLWFAKNCREHGEIFEPAAFIRTIMNRIGNYGTILLPVFNWDFCRGITFNYAETLGKTGVLGNTALKLLEFIRTRHPIYSFAVWGRDAEELYAMENISSFGEDSPFAYLYKNDAHMLVLGEPVTKGYTFVHYAEQRIGVPHRYEKEFTAGYIDSAGIESVRTYSMYVRDLDIAPEMKNTQQPELEEAVRQAGGLSVAEVNGQKHFKVSLRHMYSVLSEDIINNETRMLYKFGNEMLLKEKAKGFTYRSDFA